MNNSPGLNDRESVLTPEIMGLVLGLSGFVSLPPVAFTISSMVNRI